MNLTGLVVLFRHGNPDDSMSGAHGRWPGMHASLLASSPATGGVPAVHCPDRAWRLPGLPTAHELRSESMWPVCYSCATTGLR